MTNIYTQTKMNYLPQFLWESALTYTPPFL